MDTPIDSTSAHTSIVTAAGIPVNTAIPAVSGTAQAGQTLTASTGKWTNSPTSYAYQWWDYTKNKPITGATAPTHVFQALRVGSQVTCQVTAANSSGTSAAAVSAPTAKIAAAGACPYSGSGWADGCPGAPSGAPQQPTLLNGYGPHRPPWNVAGVDYHVGVPDGAVLTDWRTLSDSNLSVNTSNGLIAFNGDYAFNNIDFSLGTGAVIYNPAGSAHNISFTNCFFQVQPSSPHAAAGYAILDQNQANITLTNCTIDGIHLIGAPSLIAVAGSITAKYNWFKNTPSQIVQLNTLSSGKTAAFQYNFYDNANIDMVTDPNCCFSHMNYLQGGQNNVSMTYNVSFNTTCQSKLSGGEGFQFYTNGTGLTLLTPVFENNTMMAIPAATFTRHCGTSGICGTKGTTTFGPETISYMNYGTQGGTSISGGGQNNHNYFDRSGAFDAYYPGTFTAARGWSSSGNIDMNRGAIITPV